MSQPASTMQLNNSNAPSASSTEVLTLKLSQPLLIEQNTSHRAAATAQLVYVPTDCSQPQQSQQFPFESPIGEDELQELRWYIETYHRWPTGVFKVRANKTEKALPEWGQRLFSAMLNGNSAKEIYKAWVSKSRRLRLCIEVDATLQKSSDLSSTQKLNEAASQLLVLPWEILHNGTDYLSTTANGVQIRRSLPNQKKTETAPAKLPIRVLLVSPRPLHSENGQSVDYLDHRISAIPLLQAMENLGEALVKIDILPTPTFPALRAALKQAKENNIAYEVVHFDGHGVYDPAEGMGALCFEKPFEPNGIQDTSQQHIMQLIYADDLAEALREFNVPLVFLDACQTAQAKDDPRGSVAAKLLEEGVGSVVAMSHSVLVETTRRFVEPFYKSLAQGYTIGDAMLAGQSALFNDANRFKVAGAGNLKLQDWFVPVLYQQVTDTQLFSSQAIEFPKEHRPPKLGKLPAPPEHSFIGRSFTLLQLERLLQQQSYAVIQAGGGMGKTAVAVELTRWLVRTGRFEQAAFICVESQTVQDVKGIIDSIGRQLLPTYTVSLYGDDIQAALKPIQQALIEHPTILLFDNMESVIPDHKGVNPAGVADVTELFNLCQTILKTTPTTKLLFTTREALPAPFTESAQRIQLGRLAVEEAVTLVESVMSKHGWTPPDKDDATTAKEVIELVESVQCHARALVLLAREVAKGVKATTANLRKIMNKLQKQNPNDRENSLYASLELSIRRLPYEVRKKIPALCVVHGGGQLNVLAKIMKVKNKVASNIAKHLIDKGLATMHSHNYLRLDPALPDFLKLGQSKPNLTKWTEAWLKAYINQIGELYGMSIKNTNQALQLATLELPNLMALLEALTLQIKVKPSQNKNVATAAGCLEDIFKHLPQPKVLNKAVSVREHAAESFQKWNHASFENERMAINRLEEQGMAQQAFEQAQILMEKAKAAGPQGYPSSDYDLAMAHEVLGRTLKNIGKPKSALPLLRESERRFKHLKQRGELMVPTCIGNQGDCHVRLGQLILAIKKYKQAIEWAEKKNISSSLAGCKGQLANIYRLQGFNEKAINEYLAAKSIFEQRNESSKVASILHNMGSLYENTNSLTQAEEAYRQALEINTKSKKLSGQSANLLMLGHLYGERLNRQDEALICYQQSACIDTKINDPRNAMLARGNIANTLLKLGRYTEARKEINQVIESLTCFDHSVHQWKMFSILMEIEQAEDNMEAAIAAWHKAKAAYLAYRQQGGYPQSLNGKFADEVYEFLSKNNAKKAISHINQKPNWKGDLMKRKLLAVAQGQRDSSLANDIYLHYDAAAEIQFLIERLKNDNG